MRPSWLPAFLVVSLLAAAACAARAQDAPPQCPCWWHRLHHERERLLPASRGAFPTPTERAGYPPALAGHLEPSTTPGGIGYYVGGGVPFGHGQLRRRDEGTWGWDETGGRHLRRRMILGWSQGRKYQGGTGAYRTDGPVVPDLIYATTSTVNSLGRRE